MRLSEQIADSGPEKFQKIGISNAIKHFATASYYSRSKGVQDNLFKLTARNHYPNMSFVHRHVHLFSVVCCGQWVTCYMSGGTVNTNIIRPKSISYAKKFNQNAY